MVSCQTWLPFKNRKRLETRFQPEIPFSFVSRPSQFNLQLTATLGKRLWLAGDSKFRFQEPWLAIIFTTLAEGLGNSRENIKTHSIYIIPSSIVNGNLPHPVERILFWISLSGWTNRRVTRMSRAKKCIVNMCQEFKVSNCWTLFVHTSQNWIRAVEAGRIERHTSLINWFSLCLPPRVLTTRKLGAGWFGRRWKLLELLESVTFPSIRSASSGFLLWVVAVTGIANIRSLSFVIKWSCITVALIKIY